MPINLSDVVREPMTPREYKKAIEARLAEYENRGILTSATDLHNEREAETARQTTALTMALFRKRMRPEAEKLSEGRPGAFEHILATMWARAEECEAHCDVPADETLDPDGRPTRHRPKYPELTKARAECRIEATAIRVELDEMAALATAARAERKKPKPIQVDTLTLTGVEIPQARIFDRRTPHAPDPKDPTVADFEGAPVHIYDTSGWLAVAPMKNGKATFDCIARTGAVTAVWVYEETTGKILPVPLDGHVAVVAGDTMVVHIANRDRNGMATIVRNS